MWQKFKEQLPAVLFTVLILLGGAYWFSTKQEKAMAEISSKHDASLQELKTQHAAELQSATEETRRVHTLLQSAIEKRSADALMSGEEFAKVNAEKVNQIAEAVATKLQPNMPLPKTPEEAEALQNDHIDKVSTRMAGKIQPILTEMSRNQNLTRDSINAYSQRISDQVSAVLTAELAKNQELNNSLVSTQAVARDSQRLAHETMALYLSSFKDQSLVTRLLSLPANLVTDIAKFNVVDSKDRRKMEQRYVGQMNAIDNRLNELLGIPAPTMETPAPSAAAPGRAAPSR